MKHLYLDNAISYPQVVDGNNFLINRFHSEIGGLVVRKIMDEVRACSVPPIFVFNSPTGNLRRRAKYAPYKVRPEKDRATRSNAYPTINLFKSLMKNLPMISVEVPGWEADDVIATIVRDTAANGTRCRVVTTDGDLAQLSVNALVDCMSTVTDVLPQDIRLYKTLVGNSSDKIPGLHMFGTKSWASCNKAWLKIQFENGFPDRKTSAEHVGMGAAHFDRFYDDFDKLKMFWEIVGLMTVPLCELVKCIVGGKSDARAIDETLREFML